MTNTLQYGSTAAPSAEDDADDMDELDGIGLRDDEIATEEVVIIEGAPSARLIDELSIRGHFVSVYELGCINVDGHTVRLYSVKLRVPAGMCLSEVLEIMDGICDVTRVHRDELATDEGLDPDLLARVTY